MNRPTRGGFTLVELLIVAVLGSVLVLAAYRVLQVTQRSYTIISAQVKDQNSLRAGVDVLFAELREVSPTGGDLLTMESGAITIRSMRRVGYVCGVSYASTPVRLTVRKIGFGFQNGDSVFVFADNDVEISGDDTWITGRVTSLTGGVTCSGGEVAEELRVAGLPSADSIRLGAPIRSFRRFTYGLFQVDGTYYLGQRGTDGVVQPLVGPLRRPEDGGLSFEYLDAFGAITTIPADVARVRITMRTASAVRTTEGELIADSITTHVALRN